MSSQTTPNKPASKSANKPSTPVHLGKKGFKGGWIVFIVLFILIGYGVKSCNEKRKESNMLKEKQRMEQATLQREKYLKDSTAYADAAAFWKEWPKEDKEGKKSIAAIPGVAAAKPVQAWLKPGCSMTRFIITEEEKGLAGAVFQYVYDTTVVFNAIVPTDYSRYPHNSEQYKAWKDSERQWSDMPEGPYRIYPYNRESIICKWEWCQ